VGFSRRRDLFARLAEDRFNLAVVGRFSRGKSSLMNAILGSERLRTGVVPLTSVITTVTYGSQERMTLFPGDQPVRGHQARGAPCLHYRAR
jgi:predicted GTPase